MPLNLEALQDEDTTLGDDSVFDKHSVFERTRAGDDNSAGDEEDVQTDADSGLDAEEVEKARLVYGFDADELSGFSTTADLQRAMRLADRRFSGQTQQQEPQQTQPTPKPADEFKDLTIDLSGMDADDPLRRGIEALLAETNALRRAQRDYGSYIEAQQAAESQRALSHFSKEVRRHLEAMDPVLYGREGSRSAAQDALIREAEPHIAALVQAQLRPGSDFFALDLKPFIEMGSRSIHFDKLVERVQQKHVDAIRKRSARRTSAATHNGTHRTPASKDLQSWMNAPDEELDDAVAAVFDRAANR